jgi:serine/threonine protein kinase
VSHHTNAVDDLIDLLAREQIVEPDSLWQYLARRGGAGSLPQEREVVLAEMVREGLLTAYQGDRLLEGDPAALSVGRYRLLERLGGPASSVYRARKRPGGPDRAVKVLAVGGDDPAAVERFRREAEALARMDHPGVVGIKEFGENSGRLYLAMEYIAGRSLAELVAAQGPLAPVPALRIVHQAMQALGHVHAAALVHRDVRPDHLLLDGQGRVHLLDLGLARFQEDRCGALTHECNADRVLGSIEYLAPEQAADSHEVDIRADIYALGATFYFLLTGKPPFNRHALLRLSAGVVTHPQPLAQLRPDVPCRLTGLLEKMMAPRATDRFQTPAEAVAAMGSWLQEVAPPPLEVPRRQGSGTAPAIGPPQEAANDRPRWGWAPFVFALLAAAGAALALWNAR